MYITFKCLDYSFVVSLSAEEHAKAIAILQEKNFPIRKTVPIPGVISIAGLKDNTEVDVNEGIGFSTDGLELFYAGQRLIERQRTPHSSRIENYLDLDFLAHIPFRTCNDRTFLPDADPEKTILDVIYKRFKTEGLLSNCYTTIHNSPAPFANAALVIRQEVSGYFGQCNYQAEQEWWPKIQNHIATQLNEESKKRAVEQQIAENTRIMALIDDALGVLVERIGKEGQHHSPDAQTKAKEFLLHLGEARNTYRKACENADLTPAAQFEATTKFKAACMEAINDARETLTQDIGWFDGFINWFKDAIDRLTSHDNRNSFFSRKQAAVAFEDFEKTFHPESNDDINQLG